MKKKCDLRQRRSSSSCSSNHSCHGCGGGGDNKKLGARQSLRRIHYVIVIVVSIACYLNGLNGNFVHDDIPAIKLNKDVTGENPIQDLFLNDFWGTPMSNPNSHKSYRPITVLTFRLNYLLFGFNVFWFHFVNMLLHIVSTMLFMKLCTTVAGLSTSFSTLAGLLFTVHPIHTEAVTGIVGRADVLASVFFLLSLLSYHRYHSCKSNAVWISIMFGTCSTFAKETGFMIFLVNILLDFAKSAPYLFKTSNGISYTEKNIFYNLITAYWNLYTFQGHLMIAIQFCLIENVTCFILLSFRIWMLDGSLPRFSEQDNPAVFHPSLSVRLMTYSYLAFFNVLLLVCPQNLSHDWQLGSIPLVTTFYDYRNLLTINCFGLIAFFIFKSVQSIKNQKKSPVVVGTIVLILSFLPASNLIVTVGFVVAERILYMPSMGFILLMVYGIQLLSVSFSKHRHVIVSFIFLIIVINSLRTVTRNRDWNSRESLIRSGLKTLPLNAKMHYNYANFLRESSKTDLAIIHYRWALKLWPTYASVYNNLGTLMTDFETAERHFLLAINFAGNHLNAHYNLGVLYRKANRSKRAELMLRKCLQIEPKFVQALLELTKLTHLAQNEVSTIFERVIKLKPNSPESVISYGSWLQNQRLSSMALILYWKSFAISYAYRAAFFAVCAALRERGQYVRLLHFITRWHLIKYYDKVNSDLRPKYDHVWQIKSDLLVKSRTYDKATHFVLREANQRGLTSSTEIKHCQCSANNKLNLTNNCNKICQREDVENTLLIQKLIDTV